MHFLVYFLHAQKCGGVPKLTKYEMCMEAVFKYYINGSSIEDWRRYWPSHFHGSNPTGLYYTGSCSTVVAEKVVIKMLFSTNFKMKALPRAQRTWGLSSTFQSLNKFKHESWSNFILRISTSKSQPNIGLSIKLVQTYVASEYQPRFNFMTSTKHQQQNEMLNNLQLQNLAWTSTSKSWPKHTCAQSLNNSLALWPNLSIQTCNKLLPTRSLSSTSAIVTTSTSYKLASPHATVTSIKST